MKELLLFHTAGLALGILLDRIIGDPHGLPHPVRAIGWLIAKLEAGLLGPEPEEKADSGEAEKADRREAKKKRRAGCLLWWIVILAVLVCTLALTAASCLIHRYLGLLTEAVLTCYILAAGSLQRESMAVSKKLREGDLAGARKALSMIVGRDTGELDEEEVIKAAVETVAENASDGVIAPLLYTALGGPVLGMVYKAVNTMDSMVGYKNPRYEDFGFFAARADDVFNFLPSRISALGMIAASGLLGLFSKNYSPRGAASIWRRDRKNHSSPNSAQTESVCAGALGLLLGGTHLYRGIPVEKPTIGDEKRKPELQDIMRANRLMLLTEVLAAGTVLGSLLLLQLLIP